MPATINDLPTEIKAYIAQLCHEQDERIRAWAWTVDISDDVDGTVTDAIQDLITSVGRCTAPLYATSKVWREVTGPWLLRTFHASKANEFFRFTIAFQRGTSLRTLILDTMNAPLLSAALGLLPALPDLDTLILQDLSLSFFQSR
ncbi:hypothetical protein JCM8547_001543 [Rhodosporidiobolus lusitaniae]